MTNFTTAAAFPIRLHLILPCQRCISRGTAASRSIHILELGWSTACPEITVDVDQIRCLNCGYNNDHINDNLIMTSVVQQLRYAAAVLLQYTDLEDATSR